MQKIIHEAIANFETLSLADKAGFTFWSLCVLAFYLSVGVVLYLVAKEEFLKLKKAFR